MWEKRQVTGCLGMKRGRDCKGALSKRLTEIFFILIVVMVSPVYEDIKLDQTIIKYVNEVHCTSIIPQSIHKNLYNASALSLQNTNITPN